MRAGRRHPGSGYLLVAVVSTALGIVGILPFVMAGYAVEQLVLAPLGLAPIDPTINDGTAVVVICGIVAPLAVAASWAALIAAIVRRRDLGRGGWASATIGLVPPTIAFVASRFS